jgi:type IV pilus assembly protein PilW
MRAPKFQAFRRDSGFSLIELMIGVALGLVILASLTSFFVSTSANRHEIERTSRQIENGRYAIDTLRNELRLAGFYAEVSQTGATYTTADPCQTTLATLGLSMSPLNLPVAIYGYAADSAAFPACITNRLPNTDVVLIRRFGTEMVTTTVATDATHNRQVFVQMSRCNTDSIATPWFTDYGANSGTFTLRNTACNGPDSLYQFHVEAYYIRTYSATPSDNIPTLVKIELDSQGLRTSELVEGIRAFRVSYGIDSSGDGTPDEYRRCDTATPCTVAQWNNVTTVRLNILAENLEDSPTYTDVKTYDLDGYPLGPYNDHRKRQVYQAVVSIPNRTGPREN